MKAKFCCICGCRLEGIGNNPEGAMWRNADTGDVESATFTKDDRCCDQCDQRYVIPGRIYRLHHKEGA